MAPFTCPGGNPVTDVPGLSPRSPLTVVGPVFVTVDPARTAKFAAVPSGTGAVAALALDWVPMSAAMATTSASPGATQESPGGLLEARVKIAPI
jgi:hypothetical protein